MITRIFLKNKIFELPNLQFLMKFKFPSGVAREFALLNNNKFSDLRKSEILISLKILFSLKMSNEKSEKGFKIDEIKKIQIKLEELKIPKK